MKVIILAPGLGAVQRRYERFAMELAAQLRRAGLDAECWGTTAAPGAEMLPTPSRTELREMVQRQLASDPRFAALPHSLLHDWSIYTEDQLFATPAAARFEQILSQPAQEPVVVYSELEGGLVDPSREATPLLKLLATANQAGKAQLIVHTDYVCAPIDRMVRQAGAIFHTLGPWLTEQLVQLGLLSSEIIELPMGIRAAEFQGCSKRRQSKRHELGIPEDAFVVLTVGSFDSTTSDKRHGFVCDEIFSLPDTEAVWWVVAGTRGPKRCPWEGEAERRLGSRFLPLVNVPFDEMPALYGVADLLVLGSLDETFGLVFIEAQVAGLPVVIHDNPVSRYLTSKLEPRLARLALVDMRTKGGVAASISQWIRLLRDRAAGAGIRTSLDAFAKAQAERFGWDSLGARFAAKFREATVVAKPTVSRLTTQAAVGPTWDEQSHQLGLRLFNEGKSQEAAQQIGKALSGRETSERWNDWAAAQLACGRVKEAERGLRRALECNPQNGQAAANLGVLLASLQNFEEAVLYLKKGAGGVDEQQRAVLAQLLAECWQRLESHDRRPTTARPELPREKTQSEVRGSKARMPESLPKKRRYAPGVIVRGAVYGASGYADETLALVLGLAERQIPVELQPMHQQSDTMNLLDPTVRDTLEMLKLQRVDPARSVLVQWAPAHDFQLQMYGRCQVGRTMFESDRIPDGWPEACEAMDEVWVPSQFNRHTFAAAGVSQEKLRVLPAGVDTKVFRPGLDPFDIPHARGFNFLSVFEWAQRKGPDVLLRAFLTEFEAGEDVALLLKAHPIRDPNADLLPRLAQFVERNVGIPLEKAPTVILLPGFLRSADVARLYSTANAFVLPSRGEGYGRPYMEALSCGCPVIATRWSGQLDFLHEGNSYLIDARIVPVPPDIDVQLYAGHHWAEPDLDHLRHLMRYVFTHREEAKQLGAQGRVEMVERWDWNIVVERWVSEVQRLMS